MHVFFSAVSINDLKYYKPLLSRSAIRGKDKGPNFCFKNAILSPGNAYFSCLISGEIYNTALSAIHPRKGIGGKRESEPMTRKRILFVVLFVLLPLNSFAQNNGLAVGYGFGFLNPSENFGKVEVDRSYNFIQISYFRETPITQRISFVVEPIVAYIHKPTDGFDVGLNLLTKFYFMKGKDSSFYVNLGAGAVYTTVDFNEQSIHGLFSLHSGVGFKWKNYFIENRFRHYSNGHTASPNKSINANIISVGFCF
jgi:hypothetical protein